MYKNELLSLHLLFTYLMKFLVDNGISRSYFEEYLKLGISPHHIHRTKAEHTYAIFLLAQSISTVLAENGEILPRSLANRLGEIAEKYKAELEELKIKQ